MEIRLSNNEVGRLEALRLYQILDTAPEEAFDDLTLLVTQICETPIAFITLVEAHRQWFKSKVGLDVAQNPLNVGFCPLVIAKREILIIPDTLAEQQYATNPVVVSNPHVRFYAGAPLTTVEGHIIGTICALDYIPRELSQKQVDALQALSRQVMTQLDLRRVLINLSINNAERQRAQEVLQKANDELENRVENRTTELRDAFEHLQSEIVERQRMEKILRDDAERLSAIIATQYDIATAELNLSTVMNLIVERTRNLTCATGSAIELVEADEMVCRVTSGTVTSYTAELQLKITACLSVQCVQTGEILLCDDTEVDPRVDIAACRWVGARSMIVVPLHHNYKVVGVLKVFSSEAQAFDQRDVRTLQLMGGLIAASMSHASEFEAKQAQINERQRVELVLLESIKELEKLNQLKDDFLSTVSHELRTPMSNMKIAIQMLKVFQTDTNQQSQRYMKILQSECAREIDLIDDLLDLQRLEAASYPLSLVETVNLQEWLPSLMEPFRVRTQERQQNLQINLSPDLPPLISNRESLERILAELLNNACKYTASGGEIVLNIDYKSISATTIFTISNSEEIPTSELPRIFKKFYRVPKADRWQQGGTGLGLALARKLVERLQGNIQVESSQGWTSFIVQLPNTSKSLITDSSEIN